jgi:hypothetical protein
MRFSPFRSVEFSFSSAGRSFSLCVLFFSSACRSLSFGVFLFKSIRLGGRRAYRLGQRRDVNVYRLVAAGTVEEMIYNRQMYKQQQALIAMEGSKEKRYFKGAGLSALANLVSFFV